MSQISSGGSGAGGVVVGVEDEGVDQGSPVTLDFVGAGVTVTTSSGTSTVTIPGGSGSLETQDEGATAGTAQTVLNFVGSGVTASSAGATTTITIPGGGSGDVVGPGSATDNAVARFDTTTGKLIQNSAVTIDDSGNLATAGTVDGRDVSVDGAKLDGLPASAPPTTRAINTTAPLTGGGDLSSDRTLAISDFVASGVGHARGAVPDPGASSGTTKFLREDATWAVPSGGGGGTGTTGVATLDFGAAPGTNFVQTVITGQAGILTTSHVDAYLMAASTASHNAYEHAVVPVRVTAGDIVAGTGFTINAVTDWRLSGTFNVYWVWA